jgi:hypothetical protein
MQWPKVQRGLSMLQDILRQCSDSTAPSEHTGGDAAAAADAADSSPPDVPYGSGEAPALAPRHANSAAAARAAAIGGVNCSSEAGSEVWCGGEAGRTVPWSELFTTLLGDTQPADGDELPLTGVGRELDQLLSPIFVEQLVSSCAMAANHLPISLARASHLCALNAPACACW